MADDVARYYTRGMKFPRLLGKTHDGTRLWGGPYTMAQGVGGLFTFALGQMTRSVWGGSHLVADYLLLFGIVAAVVVALRFVRTAGRDPLTAFLAVLSVYQQPAHGRLEGRALRVKRPHLATGAALQIPALTAAPLEDPQQHPVTASEDLPVLLPAGTGGRGQAPARAPAAPQPAVALSSVGSLLAAAVATNPRTDHPQRRTP